MKNFFKKLFTQETTQETQPKSSYDRNEDYWKQHYIEERKKLIDKIEELKKVYNKEKNIYQEQTFKEMEAKEMEAEKNNAVSYSMLQIHSSIAEDLYKNDLLPKSLRFYNYLSNLAETTQDNNIYLLEKILDTIISHKKEENVENSHRNWMSEQKEYIEKRKKDLKHKEKELEEREVNIVKIEASQIILNSELAKELTINLK